MPAPRLHPPLARPRIPPHLPAARGPTPSSDAGAGWPAFLDGLFLNLDLTLPAGSTGGTVEMPAVESPVEEVVVVTPQDEAEADAAAAEETPAAAPAETAVEIDTAVTSTMTTTPDADGLVDAPPEAVLPDPTAMPATATAAEAEDAGAGLALDPGEVEAVVSELAEPAVEEADAAAGEAAGVVAPDGRADSMAAVRVQVVTAATALPPPTVAGSGGAAAQPVVDAAAERARLLRLTDDGLPASADAAIPPVPEGLPVPPEPTEAEPVPRANQLIEATAGRRLPDQTPPPLRPTLLGNRPRLDARPISREDLEAARAVLDTGPQMSMLDDPRQPMMDLRDRLLFPPAAPEAHVASPLLVDRPPPQPVSTPETRTQAAEVFARLLARPRDSATQMLHLVRNEVFAGAVMVEVGEYGQAEMLPQLEPALQQQLMDIATAAGVAAGDLDQAISRRREVITQEEAAAHAAAAVCSSTAIDGYGVSTESVQSTIANEHAAMLARSDAVRAAARGGPGATTEVRRDALITRLQRREAQLTAGYRRAREERERQLDEANAAQGNAYRAAAQSDELQVFSIDAVGVARKQAMVDLFAARIRVPADPATLSHGEQADLNAVCQQWASDQINGASTTIDSLKTVAVRRTSNDIADVKAAGIAAREAVRDWAEESGAEERDWWDRLWEWADDWSAQVDANAEAWQAVQSQATAVAVTQDLQLLGRLQDATDAHIGREALLDANRLDAHQREIADRFFRSGGAANPIDLVAELTIRRIFDERRAALSTQLRDRFTNDELAPERIGQMVGGDVYGRATRLYRAFHGTWGILSEGGTEEDVVYQELEGLNPIQRLGLKKVYRARYHRDLETEIDDEMQEGEYDHAMGLLEGNAAAAAAGALYAAMHQEFLGTGWGTDSATIHTVLRSLRTPEERAEAIRVYEDLYGDTPLLQQIQEELDDWATIGTWDSDRATAEYAGDWAAADAVELRHISRGTWFHSSTVDEMAGVYERARAEINQQAEREHWSSARRDIELQARLSGIDRAFDARYAAPGQTGALGAEFAHAAGAEETFWGFNPDNRAAGADLLQALQDNDMQRADAARLRLERTSRITDDDVVNRTYRSSYDRALFDASLDVGPGARRRLMEGLEREEEGRGNRGQPPLTPYERDRREREIGRRVQAEVQVLALERSTRAVARMESEYETAYGEPASRVVEEGTSGRDREQARLLRLNGGHLTPYQQFDFAVRDIGTREAEAAAAFHGMTRAQIEDLDREWRRDHNDESLLERARSEMDGRDLLEVEIALRGEPETMDDEIESLRMRADFEGPTNRFNAGVATEEHQHLALQLAHLEGLRGRMNRSDLTRAERDDLLDGYRAQATLVSDSIRAYREQREAVTSGIITAIGIAVGVAIALVAMTFTGGAAFLAVMALVGSLVSTTVTIVTKAVLMGNAYGGEELFADIGIGVIDAVVAVMTVGLSEKLLGPLTVTARGATPALRAAGTGVMRRAWTFSNGAITRQFGSSRFLNTLGRSSSVWNRMAAHGIAGTAENLAQSLPSALVSSATSDAVWDGRVNPVTGILGGAVESLRPSLAMGLGFQAGFAGLGRLGRALGRGASLVRGPHLDGDVHLRAPEHLRPGHPDYDGALTDYRQAFPDAGDGEFRAWLDGQHATAQGRFERQQTQRSEARAQLAEALPPEVRALAGELPVTVVSGPEFRRLNGLRGGDATVVVRDGQVHVVVREGADPHAVRRQLDDHVDFLRHNVEPGTAGRIADPRASLPRDLRGRMLVEVDPELPARTAFVTTKGEPRLVIGPGTRAADIRHHVATARAQMRLHGAYGRVVQLLDHLAGWVLRHGEPPRGTLAWEARQELRKLPEIIAASRTELGHPDLTAHQRAEFEADIAHLEAQLARHKATLDAWDLRPGRGFIAAEGRPQRPLAELDAAHDEWMAGMRRYVAGEGPPPLPWLGPEPRLAPNGTWRGSHPAEAYAAYRALLREGNHLYEAGIWRDLESGEYLVMLGRRGDISGPAASPGRTWETVLHYHPNLENAPRYTLPSPVDLGQAVDTTLDLGSDRGHRNRPHVEIVESRINGHLTRVVAVSDRTGLRLEIGPRAAGAEAAPTVLPAPDVMGEYQQHWRGLGTGTGQAIDPGRGTVWVPPGSQETRTLLRDWAVLKGHADMIARIDAAAPEIGGLPGVTLTMAGELPARARPYDGTPPDHPAAPAGHRYQIVSAPDGTVRYQLRHERGPRLALLYHGEPPRPSIVPAGTARAIEALGLPPAQRPPPPQDLRLPPGDANAWPGLRALDPDRLTYRNGEGGELELWHRDGSRARSAAGENLVLRRVGERWQAMPEAWRVLEVRPLRPDGTLGSPAMRAVPGHWEAALQAGMPDPRDLRRAYRREPDGRLASSTRTILDPGGLRYRRVAGVWELHRPDSPSGERYVLRQEGGSWHAERGGWQSDVLSARGGNRADPAGPARWVREVDSEAYLQRLRDVQSRHGRRSHGGPWDWENHAGQPTHTWQVGDPIDMPRPNGHYPPYDMARERYWMNRAHYEIQSRARGEATRILGSPDPILAFSDADLRALAGRAPPADGGGTYQLEHNAAPQRATNALRQAGFPRALADRLAHVSHPDTFFPVTRADHIEFDEIARRMDLEWQRVRPEDISGDVFDERVSPFLANPDARHVLANLPERFVREMIDVFRANAGHYDMRASERSRAFAESFERRCRALGIPWRFPR